MRSQAQPTAAYGRYKLHHALKAADVPAGEALDPAEPVVHSVRVKPQLARRRAHDA